MFLFVACKDKCFGPPKLFSILSPNHFQIIHIVLFIIFSTIKFTCTLGDEGEFDLLFFLKISFYFI